MQKNNGRLIALSVVISLVLHTLLVALIALLLFKKPGKIPPPPRQYFVDIVTLPVKKKLQEKAHPKKEKHKVAANISRKGIARKYNKKERLPLAMINRIPKSTIVESSMKANPKSPSKKGKHRKKTLKKSKAGLKTQEKKAKITKTTKPSGNIPPRKKSAPTRIAKKRSPPIKSIKGALYNPFLSKPHPGFAGGSSRGYEYKKSKRSATVSIGTQSLKYASYMQHVRDQIEGVWEYPEEAQMRNQQGDLLILFTIGKSGQLVRVKLLRSSGFPLLDQAALDAVKEAAPFPPLPKRLHIDTLNVYATFSYRLYAWFIQ